MKECIKKYGEGLKSEVDQAFRIFEKISLGELAGILAVMGEDRLKSLDPIHLVKELRLTLTQPKMLNLYLVAAGYIDTIKELMEFVEPGSKRMLEMRVDELVADLGKEDRARRGLCNQWQLENDEQPGVDPNIACQTEQTGIIGCRYAELH